VVRKLREAEADLASGTALEQLCKKLGVSEATYHRWSKQHGGAGAEEVSG
jgi:putative transposase